MARTSKLCESPQCVRIVAGVKRPTSKDMKPISKDLVGIHPSRISLSIEDLHSPLQLYHMLLRQAAEGPQRPDTVLLWCPWCKERTKPSPRFSNEDGTLYVDNDARWTCGAYRPLYLVPSSQCLNCHGRRLVPREINIPFISNKALTNIQRMFGVYSLLVKGALLDTWPSESHGPRQF